MIDKMTPRQAHRMLKRRRGALAELARDLNVTAVHVSLVLRGRAQSARVEEAAIEKAEKEAAQTAISA